MKTTHLLVALNVGVFLIMLKVGGAPEIWGFSTHTLVLFGAAYGPLVLEGQAQRLLTANFIHMGALHLGMNMIALMQVGPRLEDRIGRGRFAVVYVASGVAGSMVSVAAHFAEPAVSAGASGAICGLIGAAAALAHAAGPEGRPLRNSMLGWAASTFALGYVIHADNAAHGGGLVVGAGLGWLMRRARSADRPIGVESFALLALVAAAFGVEIQLRDRAVTSSELITRGFDLAKAGDEDGALTEFERATRLEPRFALAWYDVGVSHSRRDEHDLALDAYRKAHELEPKRAKYTRGVAHALLRIGRSAREAGRLEASEAALREAIAIDDRSAWAHAELALTLAENDENAHEAEAEARRSIAMAPSRIGYSALVSLFTKQHREEEAANAFRDSSSLVAYPDESTQDGDDAP